jgi:hypothetical protein
MCQVKQHLSVVVALDASHRPPRRRADGRHRALAPVVAHIEFALRALGDVLAARGATSDLVLVGGAALLLRGTVSRPTKDGDIVGERLPDGSIRRLDHLLAAVLGRLGLDDDHDDAGR